jgi:DNA-binding PadR family transcriptional regulator
MPTRDRQPLLQGTLDLLILKTLAGGRAHGQGVARAIQAVSRDRILVDHGSLYPALQRLEERGWILSPAPRRGPPSRWSCSSSPRSPRC